MTTKGMTLYDKLVNKGIATSEELSLVKSLMSGSWEEVSHAVSLMQTDYRSINQLLGAGEED